MSSYANDLIVAVDQVLDSWLSRCVIDTAVRLSGGCSQHLQKAATDLARSVHEPVMTDLRALLETDVDQQGQNPLSVLRAAVRFPTALLLQYGIAPPARSEFDERMFPADAYALSPGNWADIAESLAEPGMIWGVWKAKTVLDRRRAEGLR